MNVITVRKNNQVGTLVVTIPAAVARMMDIHEGTQMDLSIFGGDSLLLRRIKEK